jgi:uncharacterized protein DUF7033
VIVYTHKITSRLQYIFDFINKEISAETIQLTNDHNRFQEYSGPKINYSNEKTGADQFWIKPHQLLFEKGIREQQVNCLVTNQTKAFFKTEGDLAFDLFAASFYLLSRYEEYLPHEKDIYGRYAHHNSLAFRENFLQLPLINLWIQRFKIELQKKFHNLTFEFPGKTGLLFIPTYDVDIAYSYRFKDWMRTIGGTFNSIIQGQFVTVGERIRVIFGTEKDPYDSFSWMDELNKKNHLQPLYFFNVANRVGRYDKNISPRKKNMQELIRHHAKQYQIGIHPSWQSGDKTSLLNEEIQTLENITGKKIIASRQHYIRFTLPETFRQLIDAGIQSDYSMGYGSINGFRASVASAFYWYDLENEVQTNLLLYPFCFMEANSFYEQKFTPHQALDELRHFFSIIKSVNGLMITIWHNTFLGTGKLFAGWREVYEEWITESMSSEQ